MEIEGTNEIMFGSHLVSGKGFPETSRRKYISLIIYQLNIFILFLCKGIAYLICMCYNRIGYLSRCFMRESEYFRLILKYYSKSGFILLFLISLVKFFTSGDSISFHNLILIQSEDNQTER